MPMPEHPMRLQRSDLFEYQVEELRERIAGLEARLQETERYAARWREFMRRSHYIYHRIVDETTDHWEVALSLPAGPFSLAEAIDRAVADKTGVVR
jgi:uncharacterized protein YigA (DUF484 family)